MYIIIYTQECKIQKLHNKVLSYLAISRMTIMTCPKQPDPSSWCGTEAWFQMSVGPGLHPDLVRSWDAKISTEFNEIRLMVQKSGDHQLRLVVYPFIIFTGFCTSRVVQEFFHQQYLRYLPSLVQNFCPSTAWNYLRQSPTSKCFGDWHLMYTTSSMEKKNDITWQTYQLLKYLKTLQLI